MFPIHVQELLEKRYFLKGEAFENYYGKKIKNKIEDWDMLCNRVADTVSKNNKQMKGVYYDLINTLTFLPNSPTLFGAGVPGLCLSACFIAPMEDSIEGWANTIKTAMKIQTAGGGIGFALHKLRPSGSPVRGKIASAAGPIEFMRCWNQISLSFRQAVRNGANMGQLLVSHPDIEDFIKCKDKDGELSAFNISVMITDEFMQCVKDKKPFNLTWNGNVVKTIDANKLWNDICEHAWKTGEPGILFYDEMQKGSPAPDVEVYGNPCSEANLPMLGACNLGSINLSNFVHEDEDECKMFFDFDDFASVCASAYMFLDDLIDVNQYPTPEIAEVVKGYRQIGLGVMGLADVFVSMGIVYGSEKSIELTNAIMATKQETEKFMNKKLGKDRGNYPKLKSSKHQRNANVSCIAPTGSLSMIAGCSAGIEPVFSFEPITRVIDGVTKVISSPKKSKIKEVNVCANDLFVMDHINIVAKVQEYIDMSISKTINLKHTATIEDVKNAFITSYKTKMKGVTVYRDGCRANQTIQTKETKELYDGKSGKVKQIVVISDDNQKLDSILPVKRSGILSGRTFKDKIACGNIYTTINFDSHGDMLEVFVRPGKQGGCGSNVEAIARLLSMSLRSGVKIAEIVDQLKGIRCPACMAKKDSLKFTSCADSIAKAIEYSSKHKEEIVTNKVKIKEAEDKLSRQEDELIKNVNAFNNNAEAIYKPKCPECGSVIVMESGCRACKQCGWSKCG